MVYRLAILFLVPDRIPIKWLGKIMRIKILRWAAKLFLPVSQFHFIPVVTIVRRELKMDWQICTTLFDRLVSKS